MVVAIASILILQIGSLGISQPAFAPLHSDQDNFVNDDAAVDILASPSNSVSEDPTDWNCQGQTPQEIETCVVNNLLKIFRTQMSDGNGFDPTCILDAGQPLNEMKDAGQFDSAKLTDFLGVLLGCSPFQGLQVFVPDHPTILTLYAITNPPTIPLPSGETVFTIKKGHPLIPNCQLDPNPIAIVKGSDLDGFLKPHVMEYTFLEWLGPPCSYSLFAHGPFIEQVGPDNGFRHYVAHTDVNNAVIFNYVIFPRNVHTWFGVIDTENTCPQGMEQSCPRFIDISQIIWVTYDVLNELSVSHEFYNRFAIKIGEHKFPLMYMSPYKTLPLDLTILDEFRTQRDTTVSQSTKEIFTIFDPGTGIGKVKFKLNCVQLVNNPICIPASDLFNFPPITSVSMVVPHRMTFKWDFVGSGEAQAPDLSIENLRVEPASPEQGEPAKIKFTIKNLGEISACCEDASGLLKVALPLLLDGISVPGVPIPPDLEYPSLGPQDMLDYTVDWDTSKPNIGTHELKLIIPEARPLERLLSNNEMVVTVDINPPTRPDLIISKFDFAPKDPLSGDKVTFRLKIQNISPISAANIDVSMKVEQCTGGNPRTASGNIASIPGNGFRNIDLIWDTASLPDGQYCAAFEVDPLNSIPELREDNNEAFTDQELPIILRSGSSLPCAKLATNKQFYNFGENVELSFVNNCSVAIELLNSDPWLVKDSGANIVFTKEPIFNQPISINPGELIGWGWGQVDDNINQVRPDQYKIELETVNAGIYTTKFTILPAQCGGKSFSRVIIGTGLDDVLLGTGGADLIVGLDGDDIIKGRAAGDCIMGGPGMDMLTGAGGNDILIGGLDSDTVFGNKGNDIMIIDSGDFSLGTGIVEILNGGGWGGDKLHLGVGLNLSNVIGSSPNFEVIDPLDGVYSVSRTENIVDI